MQMLKEMIFGKRSERLAVIFAAQLALELGDLETAATRPVPANDDAPAAKPPDKARKKVRCPSTCRAVSRCWSRRRPRARAARANFTRLARTSARCWT
jgi:hypothetical protein